MNDELQRCQRPAAATRQQQESGCGHCPCTDIAALSSPTLPAVLETAHSQEERDNDAEARVQVPWGDREDKQRQVGVDQDGKAESDNVIGGDAVHLDQNVEAILQVRYSMSERNQS